MKWFLGDFNGFNGKQSLVASGHVLTKRKRKNLSSFLAISSMFRESDEIDQISLR
jgi:hypothetical protein